MQIVLNLQGHRLLAGIRQTLSSGSKEVDEIKLEVDETWKGFGKIAVFCVGKKCQYTVVDEVTQTAKIPAEVLRNEAVITIGIVGFKDEAVMTSTLVAYQVEKGSVVTIEEPEPSIYAEILSRYADLATELIDARVGADNVVYGTLGEAIRGQVGSLSEEIKERSESLAKKTIPDFWYGDFGTENLYIYNDGSIKPPSDGNQYIVSSKIPVKTGDSIFYFGIPKLIGFYDNDDTYIKGISLEGNYVFDKDGYIVICEYAENFIKMQFSPCLIIINRCPNMPIDEIDVVKEYGKYFGFEMEKLLKGPSDKSMYRRDYYFNFNKDDTFEVFFNNLIGSNEIQLDLPENGKTYLFIRIRTQSHKSIRNKNNDLSKNLNYPDVNGTSTLGQWICIRGENSCFLFRYKNGTLTNETYKSKCYISHLVYDDGTEIDVDSEKAQTDIVRLFNTDIDEDILFDMMQNDIPMSKYSKYVSNITDKQITEIKNQISGFFVSPDQIAGLASKSEVVHNALYEKYLTTEGDSLTAGSGIVDEYPDQQTRPTFGYLVATKNKMGYKNGGIGGSTVANITANGSFKNGFCVERYKNVPQETNYLTIMFGWNDMAYGPIHHKDIYCTEQFSKLYQNCSAEEKKQCDSAKNWNDVYISTPDITDDSTWCGAWNKVLDYYCRERPTMKLGIFIPFLGKSDSTEKARNYLIEICNKYGVAYLDAQNSNEWPTTGYSTGLSSEMKEYWKSRRTVDGLHDNAESYELKAPVYEQFLLRL